MKNFHLCAVLYLCCLGTLSPVGAQNDDLRALQAHFERVITARFDTLFNGIQNVKQWEARRKQTREALYRMLWHNRRWPDSPPCVEITRKVEGSNYTLECLSSKAHPIYIRQPTYICLALARDPFRSYSTNADTPIKTSSSTTVHGSPLRALPFS